MDIDRYKYIKSVFVKHGEKLKFKMGQSISDDNYLSGSVYFIEEGSARVIYKNENKFKTLKIVSSTNDEINLSYDKNELKIDQIIKLIEENGARILDLSTDDGDLEDVFLSLTKN